jgi:hypothetical protein
VLIVPEVFTPKAAVPARRFRQRPRRAGSAAGIETDGAAFLQATEITGQKCPVVPVHPAACISVGNDDATVAVLAFYPGLCGHSWATISPKSLRWRSRGQRKRDEAKQEECAKRYPKPEFAIRVWFPYFLNVREVWAQPPSVADAVARSPCIPTGTA